MTDDPAASPIRVALELFDPALVNRIAGLLGEVSGLRLVAPGEAADVVVRPSLAPESAGADPASKLPEDATLTPRELEVLALLAEGASNKTIARRLGISTHTAKFHVGSLIDKLDAAGRTDAVLNAARLGVIHL